MLIKSPIKDKPTKISQNANNNNPIANIGETFT